MGSRSRVPEGYPYAMDENCRREYQIEATPFLEINSHNETISLFYLCR